MENPVMPNFVEWSNKLLDREDAAIALEQAYTQGYHYGKNNGWWHDLETSLDNKDA